MFEKVGKTEEGTLLYRCEYKYYDINLTTGLIKRIQNQECAHGKGQWCAQCRHFRLSKKQDARSARSEAMKKEHTLRNMRNTGLAPWLWRKSNPRRIVNPLGG